MLAQEALNRGVKVQAMLQAAVDSYLSGSTQPAVDPSLDRPAQKAEEDTKTVLKSYSFLPELADTLSLRESQWLEDLLRLGLEHLRRAPGRESEQGNPAATTADINELLTVAERQMDQAEGSASQANDAAKELRRVGDIDKSDRRGTRKRIK